jgi:hypothetical protein
MNLQKEIKNLGLNYLLTRALFIGLGFSLVIERAGRDIWISTIIGIIIGSIINYLISILPNKNNKTLKIIINIILLFLSSFVLAKLISSVYLDKTPVLVVLLPYYFICYYISQKNLIVLKRVSNFLFIINSLIFIFVCCSSIPTINIDYFKPIGNTNIWNIIRGGIDFALISNVPFTSFNNYQKEYNYKIYLLSTITLSFILILIVGVLGIDLAKVYRFPAYIIYKKISFLAFIENVQNILFSTLIFDSFVLSASSSINIKEETNNWFLISILIIEALFISFIILNNIHIMLLILKYYIYILGFVFLLYIINKLFGKKKAS